MNPVPPKAFLKFFRWYAKPALANAIEGDLIEVYRKRLKTMSKRQADLKFVKDVFLLFRPGIVQQPKFFGTTNRTNMYRNYFTVAFRVFNRERLYSIINLSGLVLGFTACMLIYLFITDELSYDRFHPDGDRIYRISAAYMRQGQWEPYASNAWRTADLIRNNYDEVEEMVRVMPDNNTLFEYGDKRIVEEQFAWVDANFFSLFNFPLVQGNPREALKGSGKIVVSASMAAKYFGAEDPMGKSIRLSDYPIDVIVSGVMEDMPSNSHFHFDFLISGETLRLATSEALFTNVGWDSQYLYARLVTGTDPARMEATFPEFVDKNMDFWKSTTFKLFLQPLESIHLESNIGREIEPNGSLTRIYTFSVIAIFILVIACVNYMNLTTARSLRRAKEVGVRKTMGAKRQDLWRQFLTESFIMSTIALLLSMTLALVVLPDFNQFAGKAIPRATLFSAPILVTLIASLFGVGIVSGFYPALTLSAFRPLITLKGIAGMGKSGVFLRKGLVLVQFAISIGLIAGSAIVIQQWYYLKTKALGINKNFVIAVPLQTMSRNRVETFREQLLTNPSIHTAGLSNMRLPGWIGNSTGYKAEGVNADEEVNKSMKIMRVSYDFFTTLEAPMAEGRNFSRDYPSDTISSIILNESAVAQLGWKDPVGKWIELGNRRLTVVGVVKDFHFESLHRKIAPILFVYSSRFVNWIYLRIDTEDIPSTLAFVEKQYTQFVTDRPFSATFLAEDIVRQYEAEEKFAQVFTVFTGLAIFIACLGTFGLISFTAERKAKEIGIRKVLGASVGNVSFLLIREFIILLILASVIAWPLTYYFIEGWVQDFVYRISIGVMPFVVATVLAGLVVVGATGLRALKAALANPVESLRDE